ncbi:hypothetical protein AB0K12_15890 [Nonomuraea sp. NPDC049419]|uniref:hypothetical protein n=1 Tax=Nonomuraea sp. NPDC049419 TaxID=3155772 RepID=UPI00341DC9E6
MFKKIATGLLAAAATTALALSLPTAAQASSFDHHRDSSDGWGPVHAKFGLAKAEGWIGVDWNRRGTHNEISVAGRLYDRDNRTYRRGGKCAFVTFQAREFRSGWDTVYTDKYCGYPGFERFRFEVEDVSAVRVKVCQAGPQHNAWPTNCGRWDYIYSARH